METPPWFADALKDALKDVKKDLNDIKTDVAALKKISVKTQQLAAKAYNLQCGDGVGREYEELVFRDGKAPSETNLPPLTRRNDIETLTADQSRLYYTGYKAGDIPGHAARLAFIKKFVGCTVP
ncbi:hypothetical protein B0H16DRAFT_1531739 [Mycena metata]|uniref:Mug135-like C-terminal domain-containing protein n=1 Tax=Mycena metata TaxID=1033252 RepID=A0AAD7JCM2_9AGAR|nr:hypothetical protein B0H16DRAFT_1531739 [Mycena metata]